MIDTASSRLIGFLLFTTAVASVLPRAEGVSITSKGSEPGGNDSNVANNTAVAVNGVNSIQVEISLSLLQLSFQAVT